MARLPDKVPFETAAAVPISGVTAWRALQVPGTIVDRRLLLTGASGGVGRFVIQLAFHLGAHVTAVVSSEERGEGLRELGAEEVIVGIPEDGRPFDVILESIGGTYLSRALELVDRRGWVVCFGASSGEPTTLDAGRFFGKGGARLYGLDVFEELECHCSGPIDLGYLAEEVERGALVVHIDIRTSWRDSKPAFDALLERRVQGKAVLIID
jgi:NADPH:quinone reductase-like Zn-dependent oxidoreductase